MKENFYTSQPETIDFEEVSDNKTRNVAPYQRHNRATITPQTAIVAVAKVAVFVPFAILRIAAHATKRGLQGLFSIENTPPQYSQRREVQPKKVDAKKLRQWEREAAQRNNISITVKTEVNVKINDNV